MYCCHKSDPDYMHIRLPFGYAYLRRFSAFLLMYTSNDFCFLLHAAVLYHVHYCDPFSCKILRNLSIMMNGNGITQNVLLLCYIMHCNSCKY